jgi:hypothetical protein
MQLHAYKPRFLFGNQIPQVLSEVFIIPLFEQKRIGQHEQNARALVHHLLDVLAEDLLLRVFFVIVENVVLDQVVGLDELEEIVAHPFLRRHVVADEQVVLFVALGAAFARANSKKERYAREYAGEYLNGAYAVEQQQEKDQSAEKANHNAGYMSIGSFCDGEHIASVVG